MIRELHIRSFSYLLDFDTWLYSYYLPFSLTTRKSSCYFVLTGKLWCSSMLMWLMECHGSSFPHKERFFVSRPLLLLYKYILSWLDLTVFSLFRLCTLISVVWMMQVRVKPGESALAFYTAENRSSTPITGVSTYNVTPMKVSIESIQVQFIG